MGDAALVRLSVDEVIDPITNQVIQQFIPSGVQFLINALKAAFGQQDHDLATQALDKFFGLQRGRLSLAEYNVEFETRWDEAHDRAGLQMNNVAKYYLWFRSSGLSTKQIDDIKLQVQGDYDRFDEARTLALRLAPPKPDDQRGDVFYGNNDEDHKYQDTENEYYDATSEWYDDEGEYYWTDYDDDLSWTDGEWIYEDDYGHYYEEGWTDEGWTHDDAENYDGHEGDDQPANDKDTNEEYFGGKGKGNDGCYRCGSKWHYSKDCPLNNKGFSKGKFSGGKKGRPFKG